MFQRRLKSVLGKFLGCFKEVARVLQESFEAVSRKIEGCFNGVLSGFQGCLKEVQIAVLRVSQRRLRDVPKEL